MAQIELYSDRDCTRRVAIRVPISSAHERLERYGPYSAFDDDMSTIWGGRKEGFGELWVGAELEEKSEVRCVRFLQEASPPERAARWTSNSGGCGVDARGCGTSPNYPLPHGNGEECELTPPAGEPIYVAAFETESGFDFLTVNDRIYEGSMGPEGVIPTGRVHWDTDGSVVTNGWRLCARKGFPQFVTSWEAFRLDHMMDLASGWQETPMRGQGELSNSWNTVLLTDTSTPIETQDYPASEGCPLGMIPAEIRSDEGCASLVRPTAAPFTGRSNSQSTRLTLGGAVKVLWPLILCWSVC